MTPAALVTDGQGRQALSSIRSLGRAGYRVTVMGDSLFTAGFWSRYTHRRAKTTSANTDAEVFGQAVLRELEREPGAVILPMGDAAVTWICANIDRVKRQGRALVPSLESLQITHDKGATAAVAKALGLPVPRTWETATPDEVASVVRGLETGTFVVKPRRGVGSAGIAYGLKADRDFWAAHWKLFGPLLVQERIPAQGRGLGVSLLLDEQGVCRAEVAHERLQQYPNSGGPSTDRRTIHAPELVEWSLALLRKLSWRGVAMVEWKADPRDGKPKLMEINGRFWGSLELARRAGVDFPVIYARLAAGEPCGPPPTYPAGVRCRWLIPGEFLRYATQPRQQRESLREFLRGLPADSEEWDRRDLCGCLASVVCTAALGMRPSNWKYLTRERKAIRH
ncbi:MAG: ATP-grasp domain-containing protein [Verrucomicrobia bacterium]|jgi:predicted ATP-grasp superfamily ATP-dependent carboligase|nr:ATP-grasp domain-containing protein [Verrucomicrobiota bacterium]